MNRSTITHCVNDLQYTDKSKDGLSMQERLFSQYVKALIEEYGEWDRNWQSLYMSLDHLPLHIKRDYFKQYMFFNGEVSHYQEICGNNDLIDELIECDKTELEHWLKHYANIIENNAHESFLSDNDLMTSYHRDNGEAYLTRR